MLHHIQVFAELHWAVVRPTLVFSTDQTSINFHLNLIDRAGFVEQVVYDFHAPDSGTQNKLNITLVNKLDQYVTAESDHWVDIKNIWIDGVPADWLLIKNSVFRHNMSDEWVDQMRAQGYNIDPEYRPGTHLRLNGSCIFTFDQSFLIERLVNEWKHCYDPIQIY